QAPRGLFAPGIRRRHLVRRSAPRPAPAARVHDRVRLESPDPDRDRVERPQRRGHAALALPFGALLCPRAPAPGARAAFALDTDQVGLRPRAAVLLPPAPARGGLPPCARG